MRTFLQLTPLDPLIARDGRPFGAGQGARMRGLPWLLPSVVAGSLRTMWGKAGLNSHFCDDVVKRLLQLSVAGAFPVTGENSGKRYMLHLPAPLDCVWDRRGNRVLRAIPQSIDADAGTDLPENLRPVMLTEDQAGEDFKPEPPPAWWPLDKFTEWLSDQRDNYQGDWFTSDFFKSPIMEMRDHVALDPDRGAAAESLLYSTANLYVSHFPRHQPSLSGLTQAGNDGQVAHHAQFGQVQLTVRVTSDHDEAPSLQGPLDVWHPLGGERRLVHWIENPAHESCWEPPEAILKVLAGANRLRMILVTPAVFSKGWRPDLKNGPLKDLQLGLVGACLGRWRAVSGWSLKPLTTTGKPGPKPIRRMVPAGSVYFFECNQVPGDLIRQFWLQPVSDDPQERRDGFGLAVWGVW